MTLRKIRHLVKVSKHNTIIYTDHSATLDIAKQTSLTTFSTDKLNLCLVQVSQYIQLFHLRIFHKPGKTHLIPDILSRLPSSAFSDDINTLNTLHVDADPEPAYTATMIELSANFKEHLKDDYTRDHHLQKIHNMINDNDKQFSE